MKAGAQFYTLRDFCKTPEDLAESLKRVADIGYTTVQISGTCAYEPDWLAEQLKADGLTCDLTHNPWDAIVENPQQVADNHTVFGCDYIGIGGRNGLRTEEDVAEVAALAKRIAPVFNASGKLFMYHNHYSEFFKNEKGVTRLAELASLTKPNELGFTLDTYWVQYGGADIADYCELLAGRLPCVHFKDYMIVDKEVRMAPVGRGNINFEKLASILEKGGTKYVYVEQDKTYDEDPFDCLKESYLALRAIGLE